MKRFLSLIIALLMVSSTIVACTDNPVDVEDPKDVVEKVDPSEDNSDEISEDEPEEEISEVIIPEKVLKFTVSSSGSNTGKMIPFSVEAFEIPAGSTLEYDVFIENEICGMGNFELKYDDGTFLSMENNNSVCDNANISVGTDAGDISDYAYGKWYRRIIDLPEGENDIRRVSRIRIGSSGLVEGCTYVCYYDNICIKDSSGNVIKEITEDEIVSKGVKNSGTITCSFEVVDDPYPTLKRLTAEDSHLVIKTPVGSVSDNTVVETVLDTENTFEMYGVYIGNDNESYLEGVEGYIVYNERGSLYLYHVTDKLELVSSIPVVNTIDDLVLNWRIKESVLEAYIVNSTGTETLVWSVSTGAKVGDDFGKLTVQGFGYIVSTNEISVIDEVQLSVYDPATMGNIYVSCTTDKNPVEYAVGETMLFDVASYSDGSAVSCSYLMWEVQNDDGLFTEGASRGDAGSLKVISAVNNPGFVYVYVYAANNAKNEYENSTLLTGGAGAGVPELKAVSEKPSDFDSFWASKVDEIEKIEPVLLDSSTVENEDYNIYYVKVDAGKYGPDTGKVAYPKNAEPGSLKIKLSFLGYGVGDAPLMLEPGYITFGVNSHSIENGREQKYYNDLSSHEYNEYGFRNDENADRETVYFLQMLMRDVQAVRYLMTSEYWNGVDIEVEGGSQGGFQAIAVGALMNESVTRINSSITWLCDLGGRNEGRMSGWFPAYTDDLLYYDSINFASMIKCPTDIYAGLGDLISPPAGVAALYNSIKKAPKSITWVQSMGHGGEQSHCQRFTYVAE